MTWYQNGCMVTIVQWLQDLGIPQTSMKFNSHPERVRIFLHTRKGRRYSVNFVCDDSGDILIESVVNKSVSGENLYNNINFYQTLLGYNAAIPTLSFSLIEITGEWFINLSASFRYQFLTPEFVHDILDIYDLAFSEHIPRLEDMATELGLSFTGKLDKALKQFVAGIIDG